MRQISLFAIALVTVATSFAAAEDGWKVLFNGKDLSGWTQKNGTATYQVVDGTIVGTTAEGSPNSFLCSDEEYADFELLFDVKVDKGLNSGVQIRSVTKELSDKEKEKGVKYGRVNGPQVEIETGPAEAGYIYGEATGRGWLTPNDKLVKHDHFKNDDWNQYRVVAKGAHFQVFINGEQISDLTDEKILETHPKGFIGLQVHGIKRGTGPYQVAWKNIKIKPIKN